MPIVFVIKGKCLFSDISRPDVHFSLIIGPSADPEGGTGGPDPPGKSQVIWVSIGNKRLDQTCLH